MNSRTKGNFILLFTAIIWGSGFVAQKFGAAYLSPFAFNASRQIIASVLLLPYAIIISRKAGFLSKERNSYQIVERRRKDLIKGGIICGLFLCAATNLQQIGLSTVSAGKSGFITAIYIVLVPIVGLLFGERSTIRLWGCVIMAMVGFGFLSLKGGLGGLTIGDVLTLASAIFFACQICAVNANVTRSNSILLSTAQMIVSAIASLICMFIFEHPTITDFAMSGKAILYAAIVPTAIGYTCQVVGQKYTDPTIASLIMSMEAVFAVVLGALFLHEHMILREILGCVIIFIAVIVAQLPDKNPEDPQ